MNRMCLGGLVALACVQCALPAARAQDARRLGNFRVPEYDRDGVLKSVLTGQSAVINTDDGTADISNVRMQFFESDGTTVRMTVTTPVCTYDQAERIAKSDAAVRISGDKMVVTGEDFAWDGGREVFKIFKNAKVVFKREDAPLSPPDDAGDSTPQATSSEE